MVSHQSSSRAGSAKTKYRRIAAKIRGGPVKPHSRNRLSCSTPSGGGRGSAPDSGFAIGGSPPIRAPRRVTAQPQGSCGKISCHSAGAHLQVCISGAVATFADLTVCARRVFSQLRGHWIAACLLLASFAAANASDRPLARFEFAQPHMGTMFKIVLYAPDATLAAQAANAAFDRTTELDNTMSDYKPESELMRLCQAAGGPPVRREPRG